MKIQQKIDNGGGDSYCFMSDPKSGKLGTLYKYMNDDDDDEDKDDDERRPKTIFKRKYTQAGLSK